jgi:hypothetical protein
MALREFKREPEPSMEHRSFQKPDERREFSHGKVEVVSLGGVTFGRATFAPGWRWSTCVGPIAGTKSCEAPHLNLHVSGRLHIVMDDGSEAEFGPGDISDIPPGHDAWVVGNDPVIVVDITGMEDYAKGK